MSRPEMAVGAVPVAAARRFPLIHVLLLATTTLTTAMASSLFQGFDPIDDPRQLVHGVPFAATLITILLVHESGHYLMCLRHGVAASMPYFLPAPPNIFPLGTFGAFIRIRSRFPDRRALFDIGAAGPWGGFVVAVAAMVVGLRLSTVLPAPPMEHTLELGDSLLTTFLTRSVLGTDPDVVMLHPVAFAGWVGLFITSLNLLPAGQLETRAVDSAADRDRRHHLAGLIVGDCHHAAAASTEQAVMGGVDGHGDRLLARGGRPAPRHGCRLRPDVRSGADPHPAMSDAPTRERPSWQQYFMTITRQVAERSTCNRAKVGAVIVRDKNILATGYNGSPAGLPHCTDVGCLVYTSRTPTGETEENCFRTIHAEINAIAQAAKNGASIRDADIYITHTPCIHCLKVLVNTGIRRIYYEHEYKRPTLEELLRHTDVTLECIKP